MAAVPSPNTTLPVNKKIQYRDSWTEDVEAAEEESHESMVAEVSRDAESQASVQRNVEFSLMSFPSYW